MSAAATLYTLITVTYGGTVGHASGLPDLHTCQEAKSMALHGQTIEAYEADQKQRAEKYAADKAAWYAQHPPHLPKTNDERDIVKLGGSWGDTGGSGHVENGMIYDDGQFGMIVTEVYSSPPTGGIKYAECVIEVPDKSAP